MDTYNPVYTVTIMVQTHGKIFEYKLDTRTNELFNGVRILCNAKGLKDNFVTHHDEWWFPGILAEKYQHQLTEPTFNMITSPIELTWKNHPVYKCLNLFKSSDTTCDLVGNITYDKTFSIKSGVSDFVSSIQDYITEGNQGIYLISIHEGLQLIYPTEGTGPINLLEIANLDDLARYFNKPLPDINSLTVNTFPNQRVYIDFEENLDIEDETIRQHEITNSRQDFINRIKLWNLTLNNSRTKITEIKMSILIKLIKDIIGYNSIINLLDYSCNSPSMYITENIDKSTYYKTYYSDGYDLENPTRPDIRPDLGGKRIYSKTRGNKKTRGKNKGNKKTRSKNKGNKKTHFKNKKY